LWLSSGNQKMLTRSSIPREVTTQKAALRQPMLAL
jgi:hypothetical protein